MKFLIIAIAFLWLAATIGGGVYLNRLQNTPGLAAVTAPVTLPGESRLQSAEGNPTILFFAHPKCPCTRASLGELARLMADIDGRAKAFVVFSKPEGASDDWTETDSVAIARAIPGVEVIIDEAEYETAIFGAQTSGTTLLYDGIGTLRFRGGITKARGHEGDNAGRNAIFRIVTTGQTEQGETAVFGCPILSDE